MTIPAAGMAISVPLTNADIDSNAQTMNAKNALAMVADSLKSMDFTVFDASHHPHTYDNKNPSRPSISHPLHSMRVPIEKHEPSEELWQTQYDELINQLPDNVKQWVEAQGKLSFYLRDPNYYPFVSLIALTAKTLVWLDQTAKPKPADSAIYERARENLLVPFVATQAAIMQGRETVDQALTMWKEIGRNDPHYDKNMDYLNQTSALLKSLENTIIGLAQDPPKKGAIEDLDQISRQIEQLKGQYHSTSRGSELGIVGDTIDTLSMVTSSLLVGYGPASVLWMLSLGMPDKKESSSFQNTADRIGESLAEDLNAGKKGMLKGLMQLVMMLGSGMVLGIADKGLGYGPRLDKSEENKLNLMGLELAAKMLLHSQVVQNISHAMAAQTTSDPKAQSLMENGITLAIASLSLLALENRPGFAETLFETLNQEISNALDKVETGLEEKNDPELKPLKVYLQQAKIALENHDFTGFKEAYTGVLDAENISSEHLKKEIEEVYQLGKQFMQAVAISPEETNRITTIDAA